MRTLQTVSIRPLQPNDWLSVSTIYHEGIQTGHATFEQRVPSWIVWNKNHLKKCRLVAGREKKVMGWAALSPISERCVYAGVCEVSVYVAKEVQGQGIGRQLLFALIEESEREGIWTLQAGIFTQNTASITLHEHCGFRNVGIRERVGKMAGLWRDVVLFERRSKTVGV